ncbi:MAG: inorganic phosphate transporter family protein [Spirochaetes bacterium]|jgi:PiT family inorganic phosphate transporter|nr:inorganic phosphate transporter family protein [Spirochaetota bacterium]
MAILIFLSGGLFLGWSLGANDAANVFGTAVGSKMLKFRTAAVISSVFVILGSALSGIGATDTLGRLGAINEIAGAFIVTLAAAASVYWMTKNKLPVSASHSIVGAIVGWNVFSGSLTDYDTLTEILSTWILCPVISALLAMVMYRISKSVIGRMKIHMIKVDFYNRLALIIAAAFGSYSLGANNIANVMGVFATTAPFKPLDAGFLVLSGTEQLFILGGIATAVGIFTYSRRVIETIGGDIVRITPGSAFIVVLSSSIVLFLFASFRIEHFLASKGLPTIPLVPVSSTQTVVGAVLGIGLAHGGRGINFRVLGGIAAGWVATPILAGIITFVSLFFMQNVFNQRVYSPQPYRLGEDVIEKLASEKILLPRLNSIKGKGYKNASDLKSSIEDLGLPVEYDVKRRIISYSKISRLRVNTGAISNEIKNGWFSPGQVEAVMIINGKTYYREWQFYDELSSLSDEWKKRPDLPINREYNRDMREKLKYLYLRFEVPRNGGGSQ